MIRNHIVYNDFSDWRFDVKAAEGSFIWDQNGHKLIDFTSGWNVTNLGWNNPKVNEAVREQAKNNVYAPMWSADPIQEKYAAALIAALPKELNAVCRATGGTEANEEAMKISRAATGRKKIIGFRDSYHGQSFGVMALGYRPEYVTAISPLVPDIIQIEYPSVLISAKSEKESLADFFTKLEILLKKRDVAAIVSEAGIITGWGSTLVAPKGFLKEMRRLTQEYGTLLIVDEVGTGFSRCGKLFGFEMEGVVPDIITLAKGMSNGAAAIGAAVVNSELVGPTIDKTNLTSTFGWTPVACAASLATLQIHIHDKIWEQSERKGKYLMEELSKRLSSHPHIGDIRGFGMEIGVMFVKDKKSMKPYADLAKKVVSRAYADGLHLVFGDFGSIQLMPPVTISSAVLKQGIDTLVHTIQSCT